MDESEHSNIQSPEKTSEKSDLVPSQEQGHKKTLFPMGRTLTYCTTTTVLLMKTMPKALQNPVQNLEKVRKNMKQ